MPYSDFVSPAGPLTGTEPVTVAGLQTELKVAKKQVMLKEFELDTVLSLARSITDDDHSETTMYQMLSLTLQGQRQMGRVLLFAREDDGHFLVRLHLRDGRMVSGGPFLSLPAAVAAAPNPKMIPLAGLDLDPQWHDYQLAIPVLRQQQRVAYFFVGGLLPDSNLEALAAFLSSLANLLIGAVENRRLGQQRILDAAVRREIEIAQQVQNLLFPSHLPNDQDLTVERSYLPHAEMGGDYYDVVEVDADHVLLCVADVSGKGVPASLLMSNFQAGLRTLLRQGADLTTIVPELNHLLFRNSGGEKFITAFLGLYHRRTRRLQFVNAGHNDPMLISDQGPVQYLKAGTVMLGIIEHLPGLEVGEVQVLPQSMLFLYTDGLTEVFDQHGAEFGEEGVLRTLQRNRYLSLARLHQELLADIKKANVNGEKFADDVTILSCRFK